MISHRRRVHFEDVDAAGIVFFARYLNFCHEAMEAFFADVDGGYAGMVMKRRIGLPAVHIDIDYCAPLRYGDAVDIETDVVHIGNSSCTLRYRFVREGSRAPVAVIKHTCVLCDLEGPTKIPIPEDVLAILKANFAADEAEEPVTKKSS
ncbi:MAG: thioesterase family protein [Polyangiaceae bacterium]